MSKALPQLEGRLFYRIKRLQTAIRVSAESALEDVGISPPQYSTMLALSANPGASNATLARICFVTPQTMNELIRGLENAKLVERVEAEDGRREIALQLTSEGKKRVAAGHKQMFDVETAALEAMSEGQRRTFLKHLDAVAVTLEAGQGKKRASRAGGGVRRRSG
ncbi:MarR family winged helix-turn-helix transcriptional regulator [Pendulispora albinea]|uniref:MarR family winged helix-turn-helix transcriptional regulator n=1 Tax=Pendulispora albinea TaxID=2741071 RepID=A0ABZ2LT59_9BACT